MPVPVLDRPEVNIWIAAGDGNLDVVKKWVENFCFAYIFRDTPVIQEISAVSPNEPDAFTYTPMHAATSYGRLEILEYLIWKGGNVNVVDEDGETPLFVAESVDIARFLIEHGARANHRNLDGMSPAESLYEEYPEISSYLESVSPTSTRALMPPVGEETADVASEELTSSLLTSIEGIIVRADEDGYDPEDEIRRVVEEAVIEGVVRGYNMMSASEDDGLNENGSGPEPPGLGPRN